MLKLLSMLTVLQTFLQSGNTQAVTNFTKVTNQRYEPNFGEANIPYWPYQLQAIKSDSEIHPHKRVKPCLSRQISHDQNRRSHNVQWIPTFRASVTKPSVNDFVSQSLREEDRVGKNNEGLAATRNEGLSSAQKLYTPNAKPVYSSTASEDDFNSKIPDQQTFRLSVPDSVETSAQQSVNILSSQEQSKPLVNGTQLSNECNESKDTILNLRRSNSNNENILSFTNKTTEKNNLRNDDNNESRNYNTKPIYQDPVSNYKFLKSKPGPEQINGYGVTVMAESSVMLMQNSKTCYACSSASDPSCWHPSRRTTVKYCRKGHDACVTRTFRSSYGLVLTRDCGRTCEDDSILGLTLNYKSCSICHHDLCNGAYSIRSYCLLFIIFLIPVVTY